MEKGPQAITPLGSLTSHDVEYKIIDRKPNREKRYRVAKYSY